MRDLTNQQWERLKPILPPQKPEVGRPNEDHRTILNGILWIDRTLCTSRETYLKAMDLGQPLLADFTVGALAGIWQQILEQLQQQADVAGELDWQVHHVDSSVIRAHQHAAGAVGSEPESEARGR